MVCAMLANRANKTAGVVLIKEQQSDFNRGGSRTGFAFPLTGLSEKLGSDTFSYATDLDYVTLETKSILIGIPL
jgi:hypothetical protein